MLGIELYLSIQDKRGRGIYIKDIARELGISERTVRRVLNRGTTGPRERRKFKPRKLEPYYAHVDCLLREGVSNGRVILRKIRELGYNGGYTCLTDYMRSKKGV